MSTNPPVGRNDLCSCGSGKKFKFCCEGRHDIVEEARRAPWLIGGLVVVGIGVVVTVAMQLGDSGTKVASTSYTSPPPLQSPVPMPSAPVAQPPGAAPAGKVWSAEHGHFHDAPGASGLAATSAPLPISSPAASPATLTPAPEGPAPEGKVWSAEHGHYHDAPAAPQPIPIGGGEIVPIAPPSDPAPPPAPGSTPPQQPADPNAPAPQPTPPPGTPPK